jgi:hypothetical protein
MKKKIELITCKQQNITKTENTTNEKQQHPSRLPHDDQMFLALALSVNPKPYGSFHPLGYSFIQTSTWILFTLIK